MAICTIEYSCRNRGVVCCENEIIGRFFVFFATSLLLESLDYWNDRYYRASLAGTSCV
jgi:hypothetical protein